ncbi:MAG: glycoside hydrolase family 3 N-terminal domain-containing protein [Actinomycetes bacterium]
MLIADRSGSGRALVAGFLLVFLAACSTSSTATPEALSSSPGTTVSGSPTTPAPNTDDPATWSDSRLAAELVFAAAQMPQLANAVSWARAGIAGLVLMDTPGKNLKQQLTKIRAASPGSRLMIGSDEEGGQVQRLTAVLGALPPAATVGRTMSPEQAQQLAQRYGKSMKALGLNVSFAPDADIAVPGSFIATEQRAFSPDPVTDAKYVTAWNTGLRDAGVMGVLKHWPGHGSSKDTHVGSGTTPDWSVMKGRDLVPFTAGLADGACAVMIGHLIVPGLTEPGLPASMSPTALKTLRQQVGPNRLIMADSVAMGAVTEAMGQTQTQAALKTLIAGADVALLKTPEPLPVVHGIAAAIRSGALPREQAITSARRVLAAAAQWSMTSPNGTRCN